MKIPVASFFPQLNLLFIFGGKKEIKKIKTDREILSFSWEILYTNLLFFFTQIYIYIL